MMKLKQHSSNCHELALARGAVLFSYETPVAISFDYPTQIGRSEFYGVYKTNVKYSKTTTRHINSWTATTRTLDQDVLVDLAGQILRGCC